MTRWLDAQEREAWLGLAGVTLLLPNQLDAQLQRDAGLNMFEYLVLAMLSEAPDRSMRMNQLAAVVRSSQSRLSHAVSRLEESGWVAREPVPGDGRGLVARLTEAGYRRLVEVAPSHAKTVRTTLFDPLSPEQLRQFGDICSTVIAAMDRTPD